MEAGISSNESKKRGMQAVQRESQYGRLLNV